MFHNTISTVISTSVSDYLCSFRRYYTESDGVHVQSEDTLVLMREPTWVARDCNHPLFVKHYSGAVAVVSVPVYPRRSHICIVLQEGCQVGGEGALHGGVVMTRG